MGKDGGGNCNGMWLFCADDGIITFDGAIIFILGVDIDRTDGICGDDNGTIDTIVFDGGDWYKMVGDDGKWCWRYGGLRFFDGIFGYRWLIKLLFALYGYFGLYVAVPYFMKDCGMENALLYQAAEI